jgi:hypothetical protein
MDEWEIQKKAEDVVGKAEQGDLGPLREELSSMSPQDRLALARAAEQINERHRASNQDLPDIQIDVQKDWEGKDYLNDVTVTHKRAWYDPIRLFNDKTTTDVFDESWGERLSRWVTQYSPFHRVAHELDKASGKK